MIVNQPLEMQHTLFQEHNIYVGECMLCIVKQGQTLAIMKSAKPEYFKYLLKQLRK